jgi:hypothetical protein
MINLMDINSPTTYEHGVHGLRYGKGVKKIFWAGFGYNSHTSLVPSDGDPESRGRRGVTSWVIHSVNEAFYLDCFSLAIPLCRMAPQSRLRIRTLLSDIQIQLMVWPPYSPGLNPIEIVWAVTKGIMYECYPEISMPQELRIL